MTTRRLSLITSTKRKKYGLGVSGALLKMSGSVHHFVAYLEADDFSRQPESFEAFTEINLLYQGFRATLSFPRGFSKIFFLQLFFGFKLIGPSIKILKKLIVEHVFDQKLSKHFKFCPCNAIFCTYKIKKPQKPTYPK